MRISKIALMIALTAGAALGQRIETAVAGDTVATFSERHGASVVEVAKLNGLMPFTKLPAGHAVRLPKGPYVSKVLPKGCQYLDTLGFGTRAFALFIQPASVKRKGATVEAWTCIEPAYRDSYIEANKLPAEFEYALQWISVDCKRERYTSGKFIPYRSGAEPVGSPLPGESDQPIVPQSVGEDIKVGLCKERRP
ncbi:MAG: surface-adhesin E family protein [Pyrinomonadaceae bacterium]